MLNDNQYNQLRPYAEIIKRIGGGVGNTSNREITHLCNRIWQELGHAPKQSFCSQCVFELFQNMKDELNFYEEKYGSGN